MGLKWVRLCVLASALAAWTWDGPRAEDALPDDGASVIMYHRFGEEEFASTNTTLKQLDAHIAELTNGSYAVMALPDMVSVLRTGSGFPKKAVGLSIDDAYLSVYTEAWPRLRKAGVPFTVFVATEPVDKGYAHYMSWDQIREMAKDPLVTIGSQTATHPHMIDNSAEINAAELDSSNRRFFDELGKTPELIAYPFGEYDGAVIQAAKQAGFIAGFGQHSGAFGVGDDIYALPRFAMNEQYGDIERLRLSAGALPMAVEDFLPANTVVSPRDNPPAVGFTVTPALERPEDVACFSNHEGRLNLERIGPRFEVRMTTPLPQGRTRINCTAPARDGRWRWLGRMFYVK
ncbi:MAG: polysaccharide deacetylase family protein [Alphaproteobacteria bacterium]|nr:polysaccharide deacetylase family protein [Alphaproteobacteria bacterium]MBF0251013.1 polysaccharide deacetylase family protein [Alphaproteobacteria bacterium]